MFVAMLVLNKMCNVALSHADRMAVKDCLLGMHTILPVSRLLRSASKKTGDCPHQWRVRFCTVIAEMQLMLYPVVPNRSGTEVSLAGVDWLGSILAFSNEAYGYATELTEVWQPYANWRRLG